MGDIRNLGFLIRNVTRLWVRHFELRAAQFEMTLSQAKVLVYLSRNEGLTQARLAELTETDPMTLVRVLDRMQNEGLLERRPDPADGRAYRVFLRPAAQPVLLEIQRIGDRARAEALAGLTTEECNQLLTLLERVQSNLLALVPAAHEPGRSGRASTRTTTRRRRVSSAAQSRHKKAST